MGKYRFSYIFISIVVCVCMNVMFSVKLKAAVKYGDPDTVTTAAIDAGADPAAVDAVEDIVDEAEAVETVPEKPTNTPASPS